MREQEYILLRDGDIVQIGDEALNSKGNWIGDLWCVGQVYDSRVFLPIRRKVEVEIIDLY